MAKHTLKISRAVNTAKVLKVFAWLLFNIKKNVHVTCLSQITKYDLTLSCIML